MPFAGNVDLDLDLDRRRSEVRRLVDTIGPLLDPAAPEDVLHSDSPAHVVWAVRGARGRLRCEIRLTPQNPPRIQTLEVRPEPPDDGEESGNDDGEESGNDDAERAGAQVDA